MDNAIYSIMYTTYQVNNLCYFFHKFCQTSVMVRPPDDRENHAENASNKTGI